MTDKIVKTIYSPDHKRRVTFFENNDGWFGYTEVYFSDDPIEMRWIPCDPQLTALCDSLETAIKEAQRRIDWLKKPQNSKR